MTPNETHQRQFPAPQHTILNDGLFGITGTCGHKPAGLGEQWRQKKAVKSNQNDKFSLTAFKLPGKFIIKVLFLIPDIPLDK